MPILKCGLPSLCVIIIRDKNVKSSGYLSFGYLSLVTCRLVTCRLVTCRLVTSRLVTCCLVTCRLVTCQLIPGFSGYQCVRNLKYFFVSLSITSMFILTLTVHSGQFFICINKLVIYEPLIYTDVYRALSFG